MTLSVEVAGKSDVGCVRTNNEDNFGYDARCGIFAVCDGMGGQAAGEVASKLAVDSVLNFFRTSVNKNHGAAPEKNFDGMSARANLLGNAVQLANTAVREMAAHHPGHAGMGSTMVAVYVEGDFFSLANVGDSRIYLVRQGEIQQLTHDHSLVMEQVRRGLITLQEAQSSEMQNIIIRALGSEDTVQPDLDDMMALPGDTLLLCSDGLTRELSDEQMLQAITSAPTLSDACDALIQRAKEAGGNDNITVLLLRFVQRPWYKRML